jgi:methylmalonyl-CoA/ethylmalonyl-CoA epimerase
MPEKVAYLEAKGISLVQRGEYPGGRYAYLSGTAQLGAILELLEND